MWWKRACSFDPSGSSPGPDSVHSRSLLPATDMSLCESLANKVLSSPEAGGLLELLSSSIAFLNEVKLADRQEPKHWTLIGASGFKVRFEAY